MKANAEIGRAIGWGRGNEQALARIPSIDAEELVSKGFTALVAQRWFEHYLNEVRRNPNNPSAWGRALLMRHAQRLLEAYERDQALENTGT
jgi:hypothetical protein